MIGERITRAWRHTLPGNDLGDKEAGGAVQARPRGKIETTSIVRLLGKGCHPQAIRPTSTPQTAGRLATLLLDVFGRDEEMMHEMVGQPIHTIPPLDSRAAAVARGCSNAHKPR
jgi:hypothetical protein